MEREKGLAIGAPEVFLKVYAGKSELCRVPGFVFREECGTMKEMRKDACQAGQNAEKQKQGGNNQTMEPKILFEDKDILVCEKPAGVPVQTAGVGRQDMVSILKNYLAGKEGCSGVPYIGLVHRLDQPVQGVMVFAKNKTSAARLSAQVTDGRMEKIYQAVVKGSPKEDKGSLVDYLVKDGRTNTSSIVNLKTKGAKKAELLYQVLSRKDGRALLKIQLLTGRHHQIRVQMAGAGMPLEGDRKYGNSSEKSGAYVKLCASKLGFVHPVTGKKLTFSCEPWFVQQEEWA